MKTAVEHSDGIRIEQPPEGCFFDPEAIAQPVAIQKPPGALIELGELSISQARNNWWEIYSESDKQIPWHTVKIVCHLLEQLNDSGSVEVTSALSRVNRELMPPNPDEHSRQLHFNRCVDAVDLTLGALEYTTRIVDNHMVHVRMDDTRVGVPEVEVDQPIAA